MSRLSVVMGAGLALLAINAWAASAHSFSDRTIRFTYGGTMLRCAAAGPCVSLPFSPITGTVYFSANKVFDYGLDKAGSGVDLNEKHEVPAGGDRKIILTYGVVGQKFITIYNISDGNGNLVSSVAITITGRGNRCSVDYQQRQPGYRFLPKLSIKECVIMAGKIAQ